MSAPRAAAQLLRMAVSLGCSFRPLLRGRGRRGAPSLPSRSSIGWRRGWGEEVRFYLFPLSLVLSPLVPRGERMEGCIKRLDFSLSSIGWRRGLGRGGAFLLVSPLLGPLPTRSSRGEDGELDAALGSG